MFSVIIPLFNKQISIKTTLLCALNQSFGDFEIIVVNDGSTDKSTDEVQEVMLTDPRIRLINNKKGGVSKTRNEGIKVAKYDYIAFLDADDYWSPEYLTEQAKMIQEFPEAAMWGLSWKDLIQNQKISHKQKIALGFRGLIRDYWQRELHLFWTSAIVLHKSVFDKVGLFDERINYGEDQDMWYRIILHYPVAFYNNAQAYYNQDAENRLMRHKMPNLKLCLPYYIGKYNSYYETHPDFIRYSIPFVQGTLDPTILGIKKRRELARRVIKQLDYNKISKKI